MSFGKCASATLHSVDVSAPGAPSVSIEQTGNTSGTFYVTRPLTDADGSPITGCTFARAVVFEGDEELVAAFMEDFDGAMQLNGAQPFILDFAGITPDQEPMPTPFVIPNPGRPYSVLVQCADHELPKG